MIALVIVLFALVLAFAAVADRRARLDGLAWGNYNRSARYWMYFYWQASDPAE